MVNGIGYTSNLMTLRSFFVMQTIVERKVNFYAEKLKRIKDGVRYILYFYASFSIDLFFLFLEI